MQKNIFVYLSKEPEKDSPPLFLIIPLFKTEIIQNIIN